jgi:hypothetical protein
MKSRKKSLGNGEVKQEPVYIKQEPTEFEEEAAKDRKAMVPVNELKELAGNFVVSYCQVRYCVR